MIKANDFIKTGFSIEDANALDDIINSLVKDDKSVIVDFSGITIFTTLFFNNAFAKYIIQLGPNEYKKRFKLENLSELGQITYKHSFDNAINYYNLSKSQRKEQERILKNFDT